MDNNLTRDKSMEPIRLACTSCVGGTRHSVLASIDEKGSDGDAQYSIDWNASHQIVQCDGCKAVSYRRVDTNSEDNDYDQYGNQYSVPTEKLFPQRLARQSITEPDAYFLPAQTRELLKEVHSALANSQLILAGVGARGLLETVVKDRNAKGDSLFKKIDDLVQQQILTPGRAGVLHQIRTLGNDAAHEAKPHNFNQLTLAVEIIENVLQEVYILPEKAKAIFKPAENS